MYGSVWNMPAFWDHWGLFDFCKPMMTSSNGNIFRVTGHFCAGNSPEAGEFPAQRPVTRSFDVFFDVCLNKRLKKQSRGWWFETLSRPLWRYRNALPFDPTLQPQKRKDRQADCSCFCPACRTSLIATRFWVVMICPIIKCLTVLEFSFILFDLCLFITIFNFI